MTEERKQRINSVLSKRQKSLTVVFENVHDPHNISAVLRSCDAVGVMEVHGIYNGRTVFPDLGEKSSASARKWVDAHLHQTVDDCYNVLRRQGYRIYASHLDDRASQVFDLDMTQPIALVFGNEHDGITEEARVKADATFIIPQVGMVQSLNISVACAVTLYEAFRQRMQKGMYDSSSFADEELNRLRDSWLLR